MTLIIARYLLLTFMSGLSLATLAEQSSYNRRYLNEVFDDYIRTGDIVYANRFNPTSQKNEALTMRVFEPKNDPQLARPLVVLTPGGGFVSHDDTWMDEFGAAMAKAGYVVAIHRFRLSASIESPELYFEALFKAYSDQKAAIRFLVADARAANRFKIDPDQIFIGGHSAGAITSMHVAYLDSADTMPEIMADALRRNCGARGEGDVRGIRYQIRGVINMSGLVTDVEMLDEYEPPLFSVHGDRDGIVPFGTNEDNTVFGSELIHNHLEAIGQPNELQVIRGGLHNDPADPALCPECIPLMRRFMFNVITDLNEANYN